jgi:hypothetical protein
MNDPEMTMNDPTAGDLAAADLFAVMASSARRAGDDPALSRRTASHLEALANAADLLGQMVYATTMGERAPAHLFDPPGSYAETVYGVDPDDARAQEHFRPPTVPTTTLPPVTYSIEPVSEAGS